MKKYLRMPSPAAVIGDLRANQKADTKYDAKSTSQTLTPQKVVLMSRILLVAAKTKLLTITIDMNKGENLRHDNLCFKRK